MTTSGVRPLLPNIWSGATSDRAAMATRPLDDRSELTADITGAAADATSTPLRISCSTSALISARLADGCAGRQRFGHEVRAVEEQTRPIAPRDGTERGDERILTAGYSFHEIEHLVI
jgi:hypothetical protein